MADVTPHPDGLTKNPGVSHERSDASLRWVLLTIALAIVVGVAIFTGVYAFLRAYQAHQAKAKVSPFPLAPGTAAPLPPEPRLEQVDRLADVDTPDVHQRLSAKEDRLRRYGPTGEKGFVHVPIERAMGLLEKKLPARAAPSAEQERRSGGLVDGGEPNSGRLFQRGKR